MRPNCDSELVFAQDTSISGPLAPQWQLRTGALGTTLKEAANRKPLPGGLGGVLGSAL